MANNDVKTIMTLTETNLFLKGFGQFFFHAFPWRGLYLKGMPPTTKARTNSPIKRIAFGEYL